ncbi:hypothetical protein AY586_05820 [Marichromatium gracile]|uniref:Inner membrane protein DUF1819 n=2 Tax=Marichromatium gracile TaxID=1048 RepID=A0ABR5VL81_MARGR|nr:hypothetical protein AY586_05820 [Marichromatium gracile]
MMLDDLRTLLSDLPSDASRADYVEAIVTRNLLGKRTKKTRELARRHLTALYGLDTGNALFRALRCLWPLDEAAQPLLALVVALARDPLLRLTRRLVVEKEIGTPIPREAIERCLAQDDPDRFSEASLQSFARNTSGTWSAAGFLTGRDPKIRSTPVVRPANVTLCLFLGYLEGQTGQRLFSSSWIQLLGRSPDELEALASSASHRGHLVLMNAGGVKEVRFPGYLTAEEERLRQEISSVL